MVDGKTPAAPVVKPIRAWSGNSTTTTGGVDMKRLQGNGLIDRGSWPTRKEIERYVPASSCGAGTFQDQCKHALFCLHDLADNMDSVVRAGGAEMRIAQLERALSFYADGSRYNKKQTDPHNPNQSGYWEFDTRKWGSEPYHQKPHAESAEDPAWIARNALRPS